MILNWNKYLPSHHSIVIFDCQSFFLCNLKACHINKYSTIRSCYLCSIFTPFLNITIIENRTWEGQEIKGKDKWALRNKNKKINSQIIQEFLSHGKEYVLILRMMRIQYRSNKIRSVFWKDFSGRNEGMDKKRAKLEAGTHVKNLLT